MRYPLLTGRNIFINSVCFAFRYKHASGNGTHLTTTSSKQPSLTMTLSFVLRNLGTQLTQILKTNRLAPPCCMMAKELEGQPTDQN